MDLVGPVPVPALGSIAAEPTDPTPSREESFLLRDLSDAGIEELLAVTGPGSGSPLALVQLRHLGGAFARPAPGGGVSGPVGEPCLLFAMGVLAVPELEHPIRATLDRLAEVLAGHSDGRTVPNFLPAGGDVGRVWSKTTRTRLAAVKSAVDPRSTIRSNRPVRGS